MRSEEFLRGKLLGRSFPLAPFKNFHRMGFIYPPREYFQRDSRFCSVGESFMCANNVLSMQGSQDL